MNGKSKTVLGVLAGIVIGAVGAVLATNPKARETVKNGGSKAARHMKNLKERVRGKLDESVV